MISSKCVNGEETSHTQKHATAYRIHQISSDVEIIQRLIRKWRKTSYYNWENI